MLLHPSRFRRFPLATHQSHNRPEAKNPVSSPAHGAIQQMAGSTGTRSRSSRAVAPAKVAGSCSPRGVSGT